MKAAHRLDDLENNLVGVTAIRFVAHHTDDLEIALRLDDY